MDSWLHVHQFLQPLGNTPLQIQLPFFDVSEETAKILKILMI